MTILIERYRKYQRSIGLLQHQPMPRSAMNRALFVYEYKRVGIETGVVVALATDVNQGRAVLPLELFEERIC